MRTSFALATKANVGSARPRPAVDHRGVIAVAEPRFVAVRALSDDLEAMLDSLALPEDGDECAGLLEKLPTKSQTAETIASLERALTQPATVEQAKSLIVALLDGLNCQAGAGAVNRVAALVVVLQSDTMVLEGEDEPVPISAEVLAATIARLFRRSKRAPLPCELLQDCIATRNAVANLLERFREIATYSGHMRKELTYLIASGAPDYDGSLDDPERVPW